MRAGDIMWAELDPVKGTEQAGRRPALVISSTTYNSQSTRVVVCPISSSSRDWPFDLSLPEGIRTRGVVQVDQLRSLDRSQRLFRRVESVPDAFLLKVREATAALLGIDIEITSEF